LVLGTAEQRHAAAGLLSRRVSYRSRTPFPLNTHMLQKIEWNGLYSSKPHERDFVLMRLLAHCDLRRRDLARLGITMADVRYVSS
jgi:hypothetical protein